MVQLPQLLPQPSANPNGGTPSSPANQPLTTVVQRIRLTETSGAQLPGSAMIFDLNPQSVVISRSSKPHDKANVQAATADTALQLSGNLIMTLKDVRFIVSPAYPKLMPRVKQLIAWSDGTIDPSPATDLTDTGVATQTPRLPLLKMTWGPNNTWDVTLSKLDIELERFSPSGDPLQAKVTLTLLCFKTEAELKAGEPGKAGDTNPVTKQGDTIPNLATDVTGTPFDWQHLAEHNGIDDPLRLPAGQRLSVPPRI